MNDKTVTTIRDHFSTLTDPRVIGRTDHKLIDILTIALCAAIRVLRGCLKHGVLIRV